MFNTQELRNLYVLLERTQLSGKESITCAILLQKIENLIKANEEVTMPPEGTGQAPAIGETTVTNEPKE